MLLHDGVLAPLWCRSLHRWADPLLIHGIRQRTETMEHVLCWNKHQLPVDFAVRPKPNDQPAFCGRAEDPIKPVVGWMVGWIIAAIGHPLHSMGRVNVPRTTRPMGMVQWS